MGLDCVVRVQSVTGAGVLILPSAPVSGTGTGFGPLPSRGRGFGRCCLVHPRHPAALWFPAYAGMTAGPPPFWIADQVRNDGTMRGIVFTLCSQCQGLGHPHL